MFTIGMALNIVCVPIFVAGFLFCMVPYWIIRYVQKWQSGDDSHVVVLPDLRFS